MLSWKSSTVFQKLKNQSCIFSQSIHLSVLLELDNGPAWICQNARASSSLVHLPFCFTCFFRISQLLREALLKMLRDFLLTFLLTLISYRGTLDEIEKNLEKAVLSIFPLPSSFPLMIQTYSACSELALLWRKKKCIQSMPSAFHKDTQNRNIGLSPVCFSCDVTEAFYRSYCNQRQEFCGCGCGGQPYFWKIYYCPKMIHQLNLNSLNSVRLKNGGKVYRTKGLVPPFSSKS